MKFHESNAKEFRISFYWAWEFVDTLEEYDKELQLQEESLVCIWPKFIQGKELLALLNHQILGYTCLN